MASTVARYSPRHTKRFPVSMIESRTQFLEQIDREESLWDGVDSEHAKGIREAFETVRAIIRDSTCFKGD